jgi:hypothetical protein
MVESFRLTGMIQVHHFIAPHAKDLWRELDDQRTVDLKTSATLIPILLTGESELSSRDRSVAPQSGLGRPKDQMVRTALTGSYESVRYGLSYRSAGKDYVKEADQDAREAWGEWRAGFAIFKASVKETSNNVAGDRAITQLRQRQEVLSLTLAQSAWPGLNLSYTHSETASTLDPDGVAPTRMASDSLSSSLSYQAQTWTTAIGSTYVHGWSQAPAVTETDQIALNLSGSYRPSAAMSIDPALSLREDLSRTTGVRTESPTASLAMRYTPGPQLTWTGGGSFSSSRSTDGIINSRAFMAKQTFVYRPLLPRKLPAALSLEAGFQRTTDRANADRATNDLSALFRLQVAGF